VAVGEAVPARDGLAGADVAGGVVGDGEGRAEAAAAADGLDVVRLLVDGVEAGVELAVGGVRLLARVGEDVGRADVSDYSEDFGRLLRRLAPAGLSMESSSA
jgi:hypothetical protein